MSSSPSQLRDQLADGHETAAANTLMLGEIPSPSGQEAARVRFLADRFQQSGLQAISIDEEGNVQAIIPGKKGLRNFLVTADNTLGLSAHVSLPELLVRLGIELNANLILLGHVKSLESCDQRGLRFFLENFPRPLDAGLVVEGISLGRLNHFCNGMVQAEITCRVHQDPTKRWEASENAIIIMHRVIRRILEIPIPQEPRTSVIMGSIRSGKTFNRPPDPPACVWKSAPKSRAGQGRFATRSLGSSTRSRPRLLPSARSSFRPCANRAASPSLIPL
jgi:tripeptide aminopeptidase